MYHILLCKFFTMMFLKLLKTWYCLFSITWRKFERCFLFVGPPKFENVVFGKNDNDFEVYLSSHPKPNFNITLDDEWGKTKQLPVNHQLLNGTTLVYKGTYPTKYPCTTKMYLSASLYESRLVKSIELPSMCILH